MRKNRRKQWRGAALLATLVLLAACGGSSYERADAVDRLMAEVGMTDAQANCTVDAMTDELGGFDMLEDPDAMSEAEAEIVGELMVDCMIGQIGSDPADSTDATDSTEAPGSAQTEPLEEPEEAATTASDDEPAESVAAATEPGGTGDWTAAQLCALLDGASVSSAFGSSSPASPFEQFEDPTRSICAWPDPDSAEAVPPTLLLLDQIPSSGELFIDGESIAIPGADQVDHRIEWLPGEDFLVLTAGGEELTIRYQSGHPAALDLAVTAATEWAGRQAS